MRNSDVNDYWQKLRCRKDETAPKVQGQLAKIEKRKTITIFLAEFAL